MILHLIKVLFFLLVSSNLVFKNNKFKIAQFTDLHYRDVLIDLLSQKQQELILDWEKPDLVVLTGDSVSGDIRVNLEDNWKMMIEPMRKRNIPW